MDQMESMFIENYKSLNNVLLKNDELLLAHASDHKRLTGKISADCEEIVEIYKQKCVELEAEGKLLQQREDELKKMECKIMKERGKLELKKRAREVLSFCKQLGNECHPYKKEAEDLKRELDMLHKRVTDLEEKVKAKNENILIAHMELETALLVSEDQEDVDLEEKLNDLQSELRATEAKLEELEKTGAEYTFYLVVKDAELEDARRELIDELKSNSKRACISVRTLDPGNKSGKCRGDPVHQLWNKKESREASLKECIEYVMKKWKTERKQKTN